MASTKENLAVLAIRRAKAKQRRSGVLDTILQISEQRKAAAPAAAGISDMSGMQSAAGRAVAGKNPHSMNDGHGHTSQAQVKGLNAEFNARLQRLIKDAPGKITLGYGYRSIAEQARLRDRWERRVPGQAPAAKPGHSNHNFGLAGDLVYEGGHYGAVGKWARANAAKYGLRFPMSYEPWHVEPINAKAMRGKR